MSNSLKSGLVLLVLGVVCGLLLAVVNSFTAPEIERVEEKARYEVLELFYNLDDYGLSVIEVNEDDVQTIFVLTRKDETEALVYLVSGTGYNGPVQMLIAVNSDYSVQGYSVVTHGEDVGFGADIIENDFNVTSITDLSGFDGVAGVTFTSQAIEECFSIVSNRAGTDFGGGLDE